MPSWTPGPTVAPLCGLSGLPPRGTNRLHPSSATHTHSPPTCRPGHATLPSQVAHPRLLRCVLAANTKDARYKHNNVQTAASAALICVTYMKVHPPSSSSLPPRLSAQPATAIHYPKAAPALPQGSGCHLSPSPSLSRQMATAKQLRFPGSWEDGEREVNRTY